MGKRYGRAISNEFFNVRASGRPAFLLAIDSLKVKQRWEITMLRAPTPNIAASPCRTTWSVQAWLLCETMIKVWSLPKKNYKMVEDIPTVNSARFPNCLQQPISSLSCPGLHSVTPEREDIMTRRLSVRYEPMVRCRLIETRIYLRKKTTLPDGSSSIWYSIDNIEVMHADLVDSI